VFIFSVSLRFRLAAARFGTLEKNKKNLPRKLTENVPQVACGDWRKGVPGARVDATIGFRNFCCKICK
jgi:hypothetical protein